MEGKQCMETGTLIFLLETDWASPALLALHALLVQPDQEH